jgi:hypothetical protein
MSGYYCYGCGLETSSHDPFVGALGTRVHSLCKGLARQVYNLREFVRFQADSASVRESVPCPHCLAEIGQSCITPKGAAVANHKIRLQLHRMVMSGADLGPAFEAAFGR